MMLLKTDADSFDQILDESPFKDLAVKQNSTEALPHIRTVGVEISTTPQDYLDEQIEEVQEFLHLYGFELERLAQHPGVQEILFNFRVELRIDGEKVYAQFDHFPAELLHEIGKYEAGISLTKHSRQLYADKR